MANNSSYKKTSRFFNFIILIIGLLTLLFVSFFSYKQFKNAKHSLAVSGLLLNNRTSYAIGGFVEDGNNEETTLTKPIGKQIIFKEKELPYIGNVSYSNGEYVFILSDNIFSESKDKKNNLLLPKCLKKDKNAGLFDDEDILVNPKSQFSVKELDYKNRLKFICRDKSSNELEIWFSTITKEGETIPILRFNKLYRSPIKLQKNGDSFKAKLINRNNYSLAYNDPSVVFAFPETNNKPSESIIKVNRESTNTFLVKDVSTNNSYKVNKDNPYFIWNGWMISITSIKGWFPFIGIICLIVLGFIFFLFQMNSLFGLENKTILYNIENRVIRISAVYMIFSFLSILFMNHVYLSDSYERNFLLLYSSLIVSWVFIVLFMYIGRTQFSFLEKEKHKFLQGRFFNNFYVVLFFSIGVIIIAKVLTKNESIIIPLINQKFPVVHLTKILVFVIVIFTKNKLFKGHLPSHILLWLSVFLMSYLTNDFGSLFFTIISYVVVSLVYSSNILIPNIFNKRSWTGKKNKEKDLYPTIKAKYILLSVPLVLTSLFFLPQIFKVITNLGFPEKELAKLYRFILPYYDLESDIFLALGNGHKESQAKIFWTLDNIFETSNLGYGNDFRTINFFTTWHTDLAFLSYLQFGGFLLGVVLLVLVLFLIYDNLFILFGLRRVIQPRFAEDENKKIKNFISRHIFVYFIGVYILVQTVYPILSNLTILPLTGQPIPMLSLSVTENYITPFFLGFFYLFVGRVIHHNSLLFKNKYTKEPKEVINDTKAPDWFFKNIITPTKQKTIRFFILSNLLLIILGVVKFYFVSNRSLNTQSYSLLYKDKENSYIEEFIQNLNEKGELTNQEFVDKANDIFNTIEKKELYKKREFIHDIKHYIFSKAYKTNGTYPLAKIRFNQKNKTFDLRSKDFQKREIYKNRVTRNMSYQNYFRDKSIKDFGDSELTDNTKVYLTNSQIQILNNIENQLENSFFTLNPSFQPDYNNLIYDSEHDFAKIINVNGVNYKVLKYPTIGEVKPFSDTYDKSLQAIITQYLNNYVSQDTTKMKVSSVVIAENKTGNVRVASSYPNLVNTFGEQKKQVYDQIKPFISYVDYRSFNNYVFAEAQIGSTIKPIYTFAGLMAEPEIKDNKKVLLNADIPYYIRKSNDAIAKSYFTYFINDTERRKELGDALYKAFDIKLINTFEYPNNNEIKKPIPYNLHFIKDTLNRKNDLRIKNNKFTTDFRNSIALGQADVKISLASLVQTYIRIRERKRINLTPYKMVNQENIDNIDFIDSITVAPIYKGMSGTINNGTARRALHSTFKQISYYKDNPSLFMAKTGTVQYPTGNKKKSALKLNSHAYLIVITPSHTIGVSLFGDLDNGNDELHAKGILRELLPLLNIWRDGKYLKPN